MSFLSLKSDDEKRRIIEIISMIGCVILLIVISRLETRLFSFGELLSVNREFVSTLIYFALINLNVILTLVFGFLLFRNITKLVVERRKGVLGSALRKKLVISLIFFALAPTLILFYVTTHFITTSFETWFSEKVEITIRKTQEAGSHIYKQDQIRLASLARIALQRVSYQASMDSDLSGIQKSDVQGLQSFDVEYGLTKLRVYSDQGDLLWSNTKNEKTAISRVDNSYAINAINFFESNPIAKSHSYVSAHDSRDIVYGSAPIRDVLKNKLRGVVIAEVWFDTQLLKSVQQIMDDFADLKPGVQLIRLSYMILLGVLVLLILFAATWMGFYVAKEITGPIQNLAIATREVALGNYNINLKVPSDDEMGQLVGAFNKMTHDLNEQKLVTERTQGFLEKTNDELQHKSQYLEIILRHITAGVLSIDSHQKIASINAAAEKLLKINMRDVKDKNLRDALGSQLYETFWLPIRDGLIQDGHFHGQLELSKFGNEVSLIVNGAHLRDENAVEMGYVIVFEDAFEKMQVQRVIAWREVARRIAHEIKNPITPIKLNSQRLLRKFKNRFEGSDREVFESCMETIISQVDSLRDLVNEFGKFSKLPNIKPKLDHIDQVLLEVVNLFKLSYVDVIFEFECAVKIPPFPIDREQIKRAFVNIYSNAVASLESSRPGKITSVIRFVEDISLLRIEIRDNGCGIPQELKERVLEPYFSTKTEGTGLGLAIVHQVVTDHGGYLRLLDHSPYGSIVVIELPIV